MIAGTVTHAGRMAINGSYDFGVFVKTSGRSLMTAHNKRLFNSTVVIIADRRKNLKPIKAERRSV